MLERLLILLVVLIGVATVWLGWRLWMRRRLAALQEDGLPDALRALVESGRPALLYFTSDGCVQCTFQQAPVLERLRVEMDVPVYTIDAVVQADLADHFGVMTVPTTVILDPLRRPAAINYGLAPLPKLQQQVQALV